MIIFYNTRYKNDKQYKYEYVNLNLIKQQILHYYSLSTIQSFF